MARINTGILSNASPLTSEQIKKLEQRALETESVFVYLNENGDICFTGKLDPKLVKDLAWHNVHQLVKLDSTVAKKTFTRTGLTTYDPGALFKKYTMDSEWGRVTVIDSSTTKLPSMAFIGQSDLTMVIIPDSVTEIGSSAFYDCVNLTEVVIGAGVNKIGSNAFTACHSLNKVYFNGTEDRWNTINIESPSGYLLDVTKYFYSETRPKVEGNFWHWVNDVPADWAEYVPPKYSDGFFYQDNLDGTCVLFNYGECTDTEVNISPITDEYGQVTSIANQAFYGKNITSIIIPDSINSIGMLAFADCRTLNSITYTGTMAQWSAVSKGMDWRYKVPATYVQCSDGQVTL